MKNSSNELENIDLHDSILRNFNIDFFKKSCVLQIALWDDSKDDYKILSIEFLKIISFDIKEGIKNLISHDEIIEFDVFKRENINEYKFIIYNNNKKTIKTLVLKSVNVKLEWFS